MLIYYIRHGEPIYSPDSLTERGKEQAEAVSKRLANVKIEKIYCSTSNRAMMTAEPTAEKLGIEPEYYDWLNENVLWKKLSFENKWYFQREEFIELFNTDEICEMGFKWYNHSAFSKTLLKETALEYRREVNNFMEKLGFVHDDEKHFYSCTGEKHKIIAVFAHQGISTMFLSTLLDIPYPVFSTRFDISHSCVDVIEIKSDKDRNYAKMLQMSNDSHLYKEGLPLLYNGVTEI